MQDEVERQPIFNVLGRITGIEQPENILVVGNHRDAWCFGAADPGSGTAVFLEIIRVFGELRKLGWRPLRTVEFASWDAEEYNLIGSTEHVEARIDELRRNGFAYLNVDVAVTGAELRVSGCPSLQKALLNVLSRVDDPFKNQTLRWLWEQSNRTMGGLGAGSDYVAFQDMAGTPSIDMSFDGPGFPYHSCYDNFDWMTKFGDPGFVYHKAIAQVWALLILEMADSPLLPFNHKVYAHYVRGYVTDLVKYTKSKAQKSQELDFKPLYDAVELFANNAKEFHRWDEAWTDIVYRQGGFESNAMAAERVKHNKRMADLETNFLDIDGGLPGREQFKHVMFAPSLWSSYDTALFPGVRDAVDDGDWLLAQQQIQRVADIVVRAGTKLLH